MKQRDEKISIALLGGRIRIQFQKSFIGVFLLTLFLLINSSTSFTQTHSSSASQRITLEVKPISKISVSGNPNPLIIKTDASFTEEYSVSDENTRYNLFTNLDNMKIVASISDRMPTGTSLKLKVDNDRATSAGLVDITDAMTPVEVVTGIGRGNDLDQKICYTFTAQGNVSEIPNQSRIITLTLTN
jgi:hypothetical protein